MIEIVEIREIEFKIWSGLYQEYARGYNVTLSEGQLTTVWAWLDGHETELRGLAALVDGAPKGIVHYRRFLRPLAGEVGIFLDDIFVCPSSRREGIGAELLGRLERIADAQGSSIIRWITAEDKQDAHRFYNQFGKKTSWITYDHKMSSVDDIERK